MKTQIVLVDLFGYWISSKFIFIYEMPSLSVYDLKGTHHDSLVSVLPIFELSVYMIADFQTHFNILSIVIPLFRTLQSRFKMVKTGMCILDTPSRRTDKNSAIGWFLVILFDSHKSGDNILGDRLNPATIFI